MYNRVYLDGIFDLFHRGHLESIKQCKKLGKEVIIGVISDKDAYNYKRLPIINENDRAEIIRNVKLVDEVIENAPLNINLEFLEKYNIDVVVHGFADENDYNKQKNYYEPIEKAGKFKRIEYYSKTSTTDIINKINSIE